MTAPLTPREERPLGELFAELARETGTLVRQEVQLAKTELRDKAKLATRDVGMVGAGLALLHAGVLAIVAALAVALAVLVPLWAATMIVGFVVAAFGAAMAGRGIAALRGLDPTPTQTFETLKEDRVWLKQQVR